MHLSDLNYEGTQYERLLKDLGARIRDVRLGPDGYLYLLTDTDTGNGKLLQVGIETD